MAEHNRLAVVDFDSTLFDMIGFLLALEEVVDGLYAIKSYFFKKEMEHYYIKKDGHTVGYDIYRHLAQYNVDLEDDAVRQKLADAIVAAHQGLSGQPDLLFPDARRLIARFKADPQTHFVVLSVNPDNFFAFKLLLCGNHLDGIDTRVVHSNKGEILAREWDEAIVWKGVTYQRALFVDDGPQQVEAAPNRPEIKRFQIVRPGQRYERTKDRSIEVVSSLNQVTFDLAA